MVTQVTQVPTVQREMLVLVALVVTVAVVVDQAHISAQVVMAARQVTLEVPLVPQLLHLT